MSLAEKLKALGLTDEDFVSTVMLRDDGQGPYIAAWNHPTLPQPTPEQIEAAVIPAPDWRTPIMEDFKARREVYLGRVVGIAWAAEKQGDTIVPDAALAFRAGLLALPDDPAVVAAQSADELTYAIMVAYKALTASMPPEAKLAFAKIDK